MGTGFKAGVSGTPLLPNLTVQCEKGCTVTVSREGVTKSKTASDNSGVTFSGLSFGTWDITVTDGTDTKADTVELKRDTEKAVSLAKIYGIKRNIFSMEPTWERECDAVGMRAACSVGDNAGTNDFDKCYPWNEMDVGYTYNFELNWKANAYVRIPCFWYRRFIDGVYEHIQIADKKADGFSIHPAFCRAGEGRYYRSLSVKRSLATAEELPRNTPPLADLTREAARSKVRSGDFLFDIDVLSAIQILYLVEFATFDSQVAIGRGIVDKSQFSASNVELVPPDDIPFLTGMYNGHVYYRNIEDLWGNLYTWVDGLTYIDGVYRVCNDPEEYCQYGNASYKRLSYSVKTGLTDSYITQLGLDGGENPHILLPTGLGGGSSKSFCCDACTTGTSWGIPAVGGCSISKDKAGLFCMNFFADGTKSPQIGFRYYTFAAIMEVKK